MDKEKNKKQKIDLKETAHEFMRSLLVGVIPVGLDYFFSAVIIYFFCLNSLGYTFIQTFTIPSDIASAKITAAGTAVGYFAGFIASYFLSTYFIFKHNKKAKTAKGILTYIGVEVVIYGFNILLGFLLMKVLSYTFAFFARIAISYIAVFTLRKLFVFMPAEEDSKA